MFCSLILMLVTQCVYCMKIHGAINLSLKCNFIKFIRLLMTYLGLRLGNYLVFFGGFV